MSRFRPIDRETDYLLPPSVQDWLPESHLARYVVDVVEGLDLSELERVYGDRGSDAYHPAMLLSLLIYGYATGTHSSRKIERATYDSLAFRFIACDQHPDHDTLATFRRRFGEQFAAIFVQVLQVARENQLSRFGTVSLDGTKIHANASRHSALSYMDTPRRSRPSSKPKSRSYSNWRRRPTKVASLRESACRMRSNDAKSAWPP
jgi:transposase